LSLAYANRSVFYYELEHYDEALLNIKWAKEKDPSADRIEKLIKREIIFLEQQKKQVKDPADDPKYFFKLSHPPNPKIPFIIDGLELKKTEKYGRGIYASIDLQPGDFIAIEEAVISMQHKSSGKPASCYMTCANCMKSCMRNLIPCEKTGEKQGEETHN
jgi:hypothetical protein